MNKDKFIEEIKAIKNQMYMVAFSILKNHEDAEDAVQDALLMAYKKLYTLKKDEKFKSWMMHIVVNQAKMHIRKNSKTVCVGTVEELLQKSAEDEHEDIWEIVLSLKSELSTAVILYYAQGYTINEISKIMHIPSGTVKSRLSKARTLLKKRLENCDE
ncbi:MAG: RNA polymerase sigma factor [Eubacterium sp.]|nr:RNA polymerase sigma factor [Eubacterium sp.]